MSKLYMELDDAVKRVNLLCKWEFGKDCVFDETVLRQELEQICKVPSPVDVVRCKDCVYNGALFNKPICALLRMPMKPDDFCCKGKLKTQEQELENDALSKELNKFGKEYVEGGLRREQEHE